MGAKFHVEQKAEPNAEQQRRKPAYNPLTQLTPSNFPPLPARSHEAAPASLGSHLRQRRAGDRARPEGGQLPAAEREEAQQEEEEREAAAVFSLPAAGKPARRRPLAPLRRPPAPVT